MAASLLTVSQAPGRQDARQRPTPDRPAVKVGPLPERSTATSTTRRNKDGSFTSTIYGSPVSYRAKDGSYQPIDVGLYPTDTDGYAWRSGANAFEARFKSMVADSFTEFRLGDHAFTTTAVGARASKGAVNGSSVSYPDAFVGAGLRYMVGASGVKEVVDLYGPDAPTSYTFRIALAGSGPGPVVRRQRDGSYRVGVAGSGRPLFRLDAPVVEEEPEPQRAATPAAAAKPAMQVSVQGRDLLVTLSLDGEWLRAPGRRFPVHLDPTMTVQEYTLDGNFTATGTTLAQSVAKLKLGGDATNSWRAGVWHMVSPIPADAQFLDATLSLYYDGTCIAVTGQACGVAQHVLDLHMATQYWDWESTSDQVKFEATATSSYTLPAGATPRWMTWSVTTALRSWQAEDKPFYGYIIKRRTEALNSGGPTALAYDPAVPLSLSPKVDVTYTHDGGALLAPTTVRGNGADLEWTPYTGQSSGAPFAQYEVHRIPGASDFTPTASTLIATIKDATTTSFLDTTAAANTQFTYKLVTNGTPSYPRTVTLPAAGKAVMVLQYPSDQGKITWLSADDDDVAPGFNDGAETFTSVGTSTTGIARTALQYEFRNVPRTAVVDTATFSAKQDWGPYPGSLPIEARAVTRPWDEGTNQSPYSVLDGASWFLAQPPQAWTKPGGDISATVGGQVTIPEDDGTYGQLVTMPVKALVQDWFSGKVPNHGFVLKAVDETRRDIAWRSWGFYTDDVIKYATPKLTVNYTDGNEVKFPQVSLASPTAGEVVRGSTVLLNAAASDDGRVVGVDFFVDGVKVGSDATAPFTTSWNSSSVSNGAHSLTMTATDNAGNVTTSSSVTVTVDNAGGPSVSVTAPAAVPGPVTLSATASATGTKTVSGVAFLVDGVRVGAPVSASPYSITWDPTLPLAQTFNGSHQVTAVATDSLGQATTGSPVTVTVNTGGGTTSATGFTLNNPTDTSDDVFPAAMAENTATTTVQDPYAGTINPVPGAPSGGSLGRSLASPPQDDAGRPPKNCPQNAYCPTVNVTNTSGVTWSSSPAQVWYRWYAPNGAVMFEGKSSAAFPSTFAANAIQQFPLTIYPPALPPGVQQGTYRLRIDVWDPTNGTWFSARGNAPVDHPVLVAKALAAKLGLERYYQYDGGPLGAGMSSLTNIANGDMLVRWTPFFAPGRGLSTMVDLTYNSLEDHSRSPAGNNFSLSISGLARLGEPIDIHPNKADQISGRSNNWVEVTDGDGTTHRFTGTTGSDGVTRWTEPPGVNLYLRSMPPGDANRVWALTRPDKVTFYFDAEGFPTSVEDRNGNKITYELQETPAGEDPGGPKKRITKVTDAGGAQFLIDYWSKDEIKKAHVRGNIQAVSDHSGSRLLFDYYDDGNLLRLTQEGGTNSDGSRLESRSFIFTYTTSKGDAPAIGADGSAGTAARLTPDEKTANQSTRLYSVIDPRRNETRFAYYRASDDPLLRWKLKSRTDRDGQVTSYGYDPTNRVTTVTAPANRITRFSYDTTGKVSSIVNAKNETTAVLWTADYKVAQVTNQSTGAYSTYTYNPNGYPLTREDELRRKTELSYYDDPVDANDTGKHLSLLKTVTSPEGTATTVANDYRWLFEYDTAGNPRYVTDPTGAKTTYEYNQPGTVNAGTLAAVYDANGNPPTRYPSYHPSGQPTQVVDPQSNSTRIGYDADGNVIWVQDPRHKDDTGTGVEERKYKSFFDYDAFGRLGRQSSPRSTATLPGQLIWSNASFDANDNVVRSMAAHDGTIDSDPGGGPVTTTVFDVMDRPTLITGPDTSGDPAGERTAIGYDAAGRTKTVTKPRGMTDGVMVDNFFTEYGYDALDRVISQTEYGLDKTAGQTRRTQMCYDLAGDLRSVTAPRAGLTTITCPGNGPYTGSFTSRMDYDAAHQPVARFDPLGHQQKITYDRNGNVKTVEGDIEPGRVSRMEQDYDQADRPTTTRQRFDTTTGRMLTTRVEYDKNGNQTRLISPRGHDARIDDTTFRDYVTVNSYDALNRVVRTELPSDARDNGVKQYVHHTYDANGKLWWTSLPTTVADANLVGAGAKTVMEYYDPGWIRTSDDPANPKVHFEYTAQGWQSARTAELKDTPGTLDSGHRMSWDYFPDGMTRSRNNRASQPIQFTYDADNNLTSSTATGGVFHSTQAPILTESTFDGFDQISRTRSRKTTDPEWTFSTYQYDPNGNVTVREENGKQRVSDNVQTTAPRQYELSYDGADWLQQFKDLGTDTACKDDQLVINVFWANGLEKQRDVYRAGDGCTADTGTWPKKQTTTWTHFDNGKLKKLSTTTPKSTTPVQEHTVGYFDANNLYVNGNRTTDTYLLTRGAGSTATTCLTVANPCTAKYVYDARDRLVRDEQRAGKATDYTFDEPGKLIGDTTVRAGNVTTQVSNGQTTTQRYAGGQLVDVTSGGSNAKYWYDEWGNIDCVTNSTGTQANCNPATGSPPSSNLLTDYHHDELNRMDALRQYSAGTQTDATDYVLDAMDRTVTETEDHAGGDHDRTTTFAYQGLSSLLTQEAQAGGKDPKVKSYSYDAYGHKLGMSDRNTATGTPPDSYTYGYDVHGSVSQLIDDAGNVKASYGYTPYGGADAAPGDTEALSAGDPNNQAPINPIRFTGKRADSGTATSATAQPDYDMGARRYGPATGRFLQQDAYAGALADVGLSLDPLTQNRYALTGGNPISYIETDGHAATVDGAGGGSTSSTPPPPSAPADKDRKPSAVERYGRAFLGGLKNAGEEALNTFGDLEDCGSDHREEACKRVRERGKQALDTYAQMEDCGYGGKKDACNDIETQVGCGDGFTAECAGNLTAIGVEAAATHRLGKTPGKKPHSCHSFDPDTPVTMADGTTKKLKDIKVGDKVLATDPATGKTSVRTVTALHINQDTDLANLTIRTADGTIVTLHTTQNHPFWDVTAGAWVNAGNLQPGHRLRATNGTTPATVLAVHSYTGLREMRDLTVATDHYPELGPCRL